MVRKFTSEDLDNAHGAEDKYGPLIGKVDLMSLIITMIPINQTPRISLKFESEFDCSNFGWLQRKMVLIVSMSIGSKNEVRKLTQPAKTMMRQF